MIFLSTYVANCFHLVFGLFVANCFHLIFWGEPNSVWGEPKKFFPSNCRSELVERDYNLLWDYSYIQDSSLNEETAPSLMTKICMCVSLP